MEQKCEPSKLKKGDKLSRISYMDVAEVNQNDVAVTNEAGLTWTISNGIVGNECFSSSQYEEEIKVTRTEMIDIFTTSVRDSVFTVNFDKQPVAEDFLKLTRGKEGMIRSFKDMEKDFKKLRGENRTLTGYLITVETGYGRSRVVDLNIKEGSPIRQVDHRSLQWLICKNKKYILK